MKMISTPAQLKRLYREGERDFARRVQMRAEDLDGFNLQEADLSHARLERCSLAGANLVDADLTAASLVGANLRGARLVGASLNEADLQGADLEEAQLNDAWMELADLRGASLRRASLDEAVMWDANLCGASFEGVVLKATGLDGAKLEGARFNGAVMDGVDLMGISLEGAELRGADLSRAKLKGAISAGIASAPDKLPSGFVCVESQGVFAILGAEVELNGACLDGVSCMAPDLRDASLSKASFRHASLREGDFTDALLHEADLHGCDLRDAKLRGASLFEARLTKADLRGANLDTDLFGTDLSGAIYDGRTVWPGLIMSFNPRSAGAIRVDAEDAGHSRSPAGDDTRPQVVAAGPIAVPSETSGSAPLHLDLEPSWWQRLGSTFGVGAPPTTLSWDGDGMQVEVASGNHKGLLWTDDFKLQASVWISDDDALHLSLSAVSGGERRVHFKTALSHGEVSAKVPILQSAGLWLRPDDFRLFWPLLRFKASAHGQDPGLWCAPKGCGLE